MNYLKYNNIYEGSDPLFETSEFKDASVVAINIFRRKYPSCTSADLQTFIIGFKVGYAISHDLIKAEDPDPDRHKDDEYTSFHVNS